MIRTLASTENPLFSQVSMSAAAVASSRRASPNQQVTRRRTRSVSAARWTNGSLAGRLDFASLMLAPFCGTASLPHILIRYYTVKDAAAARKSTVVGIAAIGVFYVLTLYLGLGVMTSGAVAHDLVENVCGVRVTDHEKVRCGKIAAVGLGIIAMALGIIFRNFNVRFLVGWAFTIAASANLPALVMLLFWPRTTKQGIVAAVTVGMLASLGWILLSAHTFEKVYSLSREAAPMPFSQPGLVTIPLGFLVLVVVSLLPPPPTAAPRRNRGETWADHVSQKARATPPPSQALHGRASAGDPGNLQRRHSQFDGALRVCAAERGDDAGVVRRAAAGRDSSAGDRMGARRARGVCHLGSVPPPAGFKFGRWLDLEFWQLVLETPASPVDG